MRKKNRSSNYSKWISVVLVLAPTLYFGLLNRPTVMLIALFAGFVSAVLINLEMFESFKAGQLEAKLIRAEKVIDEANATIEQLSSVATPLLKSNLMFLLYEKTLNGMPVEEQEETLKELLKIKGLLDLPGLDKHFTQSAKGIASYHFYIFLKSIDESYEGLIRKYNKYKTNECSPETPTVSEIELFLEKYPEVKNKNVIKSFNDFKRVKEKYNIE